VFVGSKYTTLYDEDRKYQLEKKAKQIVPSPFKPSTPRFPAATTPHPSCPSDSRYGCIKSARPFLGLS
jgi:hypothetical protein